MIGFPFVGGIGIKVNHTRSAGRTGGAAGAGCRDGGSGYLRVPSAEQADAFVAVVVNAVGQDGISCSSSSIDINAISRIVSNGIGQNLIAGATADVHTMRLVAVDGVFLHPVIVGVMDVHTCFAVHGDGVARQPRADVADFRVLRSGVDIHTICTIAHVQASDRRQSDHVSAQTVAVGLDMADHHALAGIAGDVVALGRRIPADGVVVGATEDVHAGPIGPLGIAGDAQSNPVGLDGVMVGVGAVDDHTGARVVR